MTKRLCFLGLVTLLFLVACGEKKTFLVGKFYEGVLFGKKYQIDVVGDSTNYRPQIDSIINVFESAFDLANPNSTLSQFNLWQRKDTVFAFNDESKMFGLIYSLMSDYNRHTFRYYDPTTNPLKRAWVLARMQNQKEPNLDSLFQFVGFDGAKIDLEEVSSDGKTYLKTNMRKADPRIELDFTALAAAVTLDHIAQFLKEKGAIQLRIQSGRSVICMGNHSDTLTHVGIGLASDSGEQKIRLINHAFTYKTAEDKAQMVDPTYGYPVENEMMYVATACPSLAQAEVFSEAFCIMGLDQASAYYQNDSSSTVQSYIFYLSEDQLLHNASTKGFDGMLLIPNSNQQVP